MGSQHLLIGTNEEFQLVTLRALVLLLQLLTVDFVRRHKGADAEMVVEFLNRADG